MSMYSKVLPKRIVEYLYLAAYESSSLEERSLISPGSEEAKELMRRSEGNRSAFALAEENYGL